MLTELGVDIAVFILWSRLGSPVRAMIRKPDGTEYRSGTEREWDLMWLAWEKSSGQRPKIIFCTRPDESSCDERLRGVPTDEKEHLVQQKKLVERFITEEFRDADPGTNIRAHHGFYHPTTFGMRLRVHLQELLDPLAGGEPAASVSDIEHAPSSSGARMKSSLCASFCANRRNWVEPSCSSPEPAAGGSLGVSRWSEAISCANLPDGRNNIALRPWFPVVSGAHEPRRPTTWRI